MALGWDYFGSPRWISQYVVGFREQDNIGKFGEFGRELSLVNANRFVLFDRSQFYTSKLSQHQQQQQPPAQPKRSQRQTSGRFLQSAALASRWEKSARTRICKQKTMARAKLQHNNLQDLERLLAGWLALMKLEALLAEAVCASVCQLAIVHVPGSCAGPLYEGSAAARATATEARMGGAQSRRPRSHVAHHWLVRTNFRKL